MSTRLVIEAAAARERQHADMLAACKSARDLIAQGRPAEAERLLNRAIANAVTNPVRIEPPAHMALAEPNDAWRAA